MKYAALVFAIAVLGAPLAAAEEAPSAEADSSVSVFTAPANAASELSLFVGTQAWETAYGGRDLQLTLGLSGSWIVVPWFEIVGLADFSRRSNSPANLRVSNTATLLGVGPRFSLWIDFFRLYAEGEGGVVLRTASYADDRVSGRETRVSPAWQVGGGMSVALFGHAGIGVAALNRFHDDRSNFLLLLNLSWFAGSKP